MEHADLVAEMAHVEHLSTQERLHLARRRRLQQLKLWSQREKEWMRHRGNSREISKSSKRHIYFSDSVMLLEAAARNDIDEVRRLLMKGVSPDSTNEDGLTALHQCCIDDNEEMMKLLIEYGANVNAEDSEKWTPLHAAATCGHLHLVRYLISRGANLLAVNADGNMPYDICEDEAALDYIESEMARRGVTQELIDETRASTETQMLQDLQEAVALDLDIEAADQQGATPLHIAAANGYLRVVEYLLDQHVSTEVRDSDGWQPVHAAACWGHLEVLEMLVQNGADLNAKTHHDETPADFLDVDSDVTVAGSLTEAEIVDSVKTVNEKEGGNDHEEEGEEGEGDVEESTGNDGQADQTGLQHNQSVCGEVGDICEDPELRERILQLRTEQETKRMQEAKKGRVKRSQSNTRTQSVRRTSIRDKVLTTKKDAVEEARLRLQAREVFAPQPDDGDSRAASDVSTENFVNGNVAQEVVPNAARHAPDGKDDSSGMTAVVEAQDVKGPPSALEIPAETSYVTEGNGKININVTVTINAGTLADLKKQRAQIRNSSPTEVTGGSAPLLLSPASVTGSDMLLTDSSASPPVRRFTGNTSEIVGDPRTRRCCIIS